MYVEIPKFEKCCCCVPLRCGILILGYLSLGFALFALSLDIYFSEALDLSMHTFGFYRGTSFIAERWLFFVMYCVEIAFIIVLLVGVHTRNPRLTLVYYYYGITTTLASLVTFVFVNLQEFHSHIPLYLIDITIIFSAIVTQGYLLLLIRSELEKPRESHRYVNHLAELCVQQPMCGYILVYCQNLGFGQTPGTNPRKMTATYEMYH